MISVDDTWPEYWTSVERETRANGSSLAAYLAQDHNHVVDTFTRHWDLIEPLTDDPALDYLRFHNFDGDQLRFRFQVIATEGGQVVRLLDYRVLG